MSAKDLRQTQPTPWCETPVFSLRFGDEQEQIPLATAGDSSGEQAVVGTYNGSLDFGSGSLPQKLPAPTFAAQFTAQGDVLWGRLLAHSAIFTTPRAVAIDASGRLVVGGGFSSQVVIGERELLSAASESAYLVKLDRRGEIVYLRVFDGTGGYSRIHSLGADREGGVVVAGTFDGGIRFDSSTMLTSIGHPDIFLARLDSQGRHVWSKRFGQKSCELGGMSVGALGDVALSGRYRGNLDLGGELLGATPPRSDYDLFVARFGPDGTHQFSRSFGSLKEDAAPAIAIDPAGRVVLSAMFSGTLDFGGGVLTKLPSDVDPFGDLYLASLSSSGEHLWSRVVPGVYSERITQLSFGSDSTLNLVGDFDGSIRFTDEAALIAAGEEDIFVAQLSAGGEHLASAAYGNSSPQRAVGGKAVCGQVLLTACCRGEVSFGQTEPLDGAEHSCDLCLARVAPQGD